MTKLGRGSRTFLPFNARPRLTPKSSSIPFSSAFRPRKRGRSSRRQLNPCPARPGFARGRRGAGAPVSSDAVAARTGGRHVPRPGPMYQDRPRRDRTTEGEPEKGAIGTTFNDHQSSQASGPGAGQVKRHLSRSPGTEQSTIKRQKHDGKPKPENRVSSRPGRTTRAGPRKRADSG